MGSKLLDNFGVSDNSLITSPDSYYAAPGKDSIRITRDILAQKIIDYLLQKEQYDNFVSSPKYNPDNQNGWKDHAAILRKADEQQKLSDDYLVVDGYRFESSDDYPGQSDDAYLEERYDYNDYAEENSEKFLKIDTFYE